MPCKISCYSLEECIIKDDKWTIQANNICFGYKKAATFHMRNNGILLGVKLVHKHGQISCRGIHFTRWGCEKDNQLHISITDENDNVIMPDKSAYTDRYVLPGYHARSKQLVFIDSTTPMYAISGQPIQVKHISDGDWPISGEVCFDVYAMFD